jgi:hypothetical protein
VSRSWSRSCSSWVRMITHRGTSRPWAMLGSSKYCCGIPPPANLRSCNACPPLRLESESLTGGTELYRQISTRPVQGFPEISPRHFGLAIGWTPSKSCPAPCLKYHKKTYLFYMLLKVIVWELEPMSWGIRLKYIYITYLFITLHYIPIITFPALWYWSSILTEV